MTSGFWFTRMTLLRVCGEGGAPPTLVNALMAWARAASSTCTGIVHRLAMQCNTQRTVWCWPCFRRSQNNTSCLKNASRNKLKAAAQPGTDWLQPSTHTTLSAKGSTNVYSYMFEKLSGDKIKAGQVLHEE